MASVGCGLMGHSTAAVGCAATDDCFVSRRRCHRVLFSLCASPKKKKVLPLLSLSLSVFLGFPTRVLASPWTLGSKRRAPDVENGRVFLPGLMGNAIRRARASQRRSQRLSLPCARSSVEPPPFVSVSSALRSECLTASQARGRAPREAEPTLGAIEGGGTAASTHRHRRDRHTDRYLG